MRIRENRFLHAFKNIDLILILTAFTLSIYGIIVISSASAYLETTKLVRTQMVATGLGIIMMFILAVLDYEELCKRYKFLIFFFALFLLLLPLIMGGRGGNNKNWFTVPIINFSVQPSEFVKLFFILTFSYHLSKLKDDINKFSSILQLMIHAGTLLVFLMLEGDLGTAIIFVCIIVLMCFAAGLSLWYYLGALVVVCAAAPILWKFLDKYQQMRILVGFDPSQDPTGYGYQAIQSMKAISNGGLFGCGYKNGTLSQNPKEAILPARETDMIFAVMAEEFGFVGLLVFFGLMILLIVRILTIARRSNTTCGMYICTGVAAIFIFQTLENVGMCLGMLPVIGITLPFMSSGGSSALALYMCLGAVLSVCTYNDKRRLDIKYSGGSL